MEAALQLSSPALKPEQHDARTLLSAVWKKPEPWGNPQELSGPKFPGRSALLAVLPLGAHRTVQVFGSYLSDEYIRPMLLTGHEKARRFNGQVLPKTGVIMLIGIRPEGIPWLSALPA